MLSLTTHLVDFCFLHNKFVSWTFQLKRWMSLKTIENFYLIDIISYILWWKSKRIHFYKLELSKTRKRHLVFVSDLLKLCVTIITHFHNAAWRPYSRTQSRHAMETWYLSHYGTPWYILHVICFMLHEIHITATYHFF